MVRKVGGGRRAAARGRAGSTRGARAAWAALAALAAVVAATGIGSARAQEVTALEPGKPVKGALRVAERGEDDAPAVQRYRFTVSGDVRAVRLELKARADLDLFLAREPMEDYDEDPLARANDTTGTERLVLRRDGDPALETGVYYLDVAYLRDAPPLSRGGRHLEEIPFTLSLEVSRVRVDGTLAVGGSARGAIDPASGPIRTYVVEVPAGASCLRLDLIADEADLDLRVRRGKAVIDPADADHEAVSGLGHEVLIIDLGSTPALAAGRYFVDVFEPWGLEWSVPFELRASASPEVPAALLAMPALPEAKSALERALLGTVELLHEEAGGSGVLISADGYLLTNYHVVQALAEGGGEVGGPLYVGLTTDRFGAPRTLFQAEVVASDEALDLALVRCTADRFGRPLPAGYRFPTVPIGKAAALQHGDPLWVLGYPAAGGLGSRPSITLSRGVLGGFERRGAEVHIKTDAEVTAGNSGGAALDASYALVGFPTETVAEEGGNGQLGYIRPVWLVPAAWWTKAGIDPKTVLAPER